MGIDISSRILELLGHEPTAGQESAAAEMNLFLRDWDQAVFVLKGYAGTGKTTLIGALVRFLPEIRARAMLLAPTGRAAKVLSAYSGEKAYTIHKKIYRQYSTPDGNMALALQKNPHRSTVFIVDEASMIPDESPSEDYGLFSGRNLLDDLIQYVHEGENCKLILSGDSAQLPPVGIDISPALDLKYLKASYGFKVYQKELTEVVRQASMSGILKNATFLRNKIKTEDDKLPLFEGLYADFSAISGLELEDNLNTAFSNDTGEGTVIITRSNKRANIFNREIRNRILFREDEVASGDMMMVVKNNYYWLPKESKAGFIANGDLVEILRIGNLQELYGFRYLDATIRMADYPEESELDVKLLLDTINVESASLPYKDIRNMFEEIMKDYEEEPNRKKKIEKVRKNPFFNALQVKFAYALTCHKTQGGQWDYVFIDAGYLKAEHLNKEYLRWLYTAVTRATRQVLLINFDESFYSL